MALVLAAAATLGTMALLVLRDRRAVVAALAVTLAASAFVIDAQPSILALAFRVVAALLAAYVLWICLRTSRNLLLPARLGGLPDAAFVGVAFVLGTIAPMPEGSGGGAALGLALAAGVAAIDLLLFGVDPLRVGVGGVLALVGASSGAGWLVGFMADGAHVVVAVSLLVATAVTGWLTLHAIVPLEPVGFGVRNRDAG